MGVDQHETQIDRAVDHLNKGQFADFRRDLADIQKTDGTHRDTFRQDLDRINHSVNLEKLGFPPGFEIAGLAPNGGITGTTKDGVQVIDGNQMQHLRKERDFVGNGEKTTYSVKPGDNLDHIARDVLTQRTGQQPTEQQIIDARLAIAKENNLRPPYGISPGQTLTIPDHSKAPAIPEKPKPAEPNVIPLEGATPPASTDAPVKPGDPAAPPTVRTEIPNNNFWENLFSGKTNVDTTDLKRDARGNVTERRYDFSGQGTSLTFEGEDGTKHEMQGVKTMTVERQPDGSYKAKIAALDPTGNLPADYSFTLKPNGKITDFKLTDGPPSWALGALNLQ